MKNNQSFHEQNFPQKIKKSIQRMLHKYIKHERNFSLKQKKHENSFSQMLNMNCQVLNQTNLKHINKSEFNQNYVFGGSVGGELSQLFSLRGGGCGSSKVADPRTLQKNEQQFKDLQFRSIPENFFLSLKKYFRIIIEKANLAKEENQREEILLAIQWFNVSREYVNNLNQQNQASFDFFIEFLPQLLQSAIIYLRVQGLCIQVLQICNELSRVIFSFFMTNNARFLKKEVKQNLLDIISEFEIQLNVENDNIWVAGGEFEITMIKAVFLNCPSDSTEGTKLLMSFCSGLVKTVLTMQPSEQFLDSLIEGAAFLLKVYNSKQLLKKYEIYYYFETLKWYIIQVLSSGQSSALKIVKIISQAYSSYIENSNDWLIKFCWIKMISFLIQYRPTITKEQLIQQDNWNYLVANKLVTKLSIQRNLGLIQLLNFENENFQVLGKSQNLRQLKLFQETLLNQLKSYNKNFLVLQMNTNQIQLDYLDLFFKQEKDLHYIKDFNKDIEELKEEILQFQQQYQHNLDQYSNNKGDQQMLLEDIKISVKELINTIFRLFHLFQKIGGYLLFYLFQYRLIVSSLPEGSKFEFKAQFLREIETLENQFKENYQLFQEKIVEEKQNLILPLITLLHFQFIYNFSKEENSDDQQYDKLQQSMKIFETFQKALCQTSQQVNDLRIKQQLVYPQNQENRFGSFTITGLQQVLKEIIMNSNSFQNLDAFVLGINQILEKINQENLQFSLSRLNNYCLLEQLLIDHNNQIDLQQAYIIHCLDFLGKNSHLFQAKTTLLSLNETEQTNHTINTKLASQFEIIENIFCDLENYSDIQRQNGQIDQLLTLLRNDQEYLLSSKQEPSLKGIALELALVEEMFELIKEDPQNFTQYKQQILSIYSRYDLQTAICKMKTDNKRDKQVIQKILTNQQEQYQQQIINNQNILKTIKQIIRLHQKIWSIIFESNTNSSAGTLLNQLEMQLKSSFQNYFNLLEQRKRTHNNFQINESEYSDLKSFMPFLNEIDNYFQHNYFSSDVKNNIFENGVQLVQDFVDDYDYKVKQCFVVSLLELSASQYAQNQIIFCQENIMQVWVSEKDERVKKLLKNKEIIETQRKLFSSDLKSLTNRLQIQMNQRFLKINELEMQIRQEGDQIVRSNLQIQLQHECQELEDFIENINEMSEKLDLTIVFLKEIKKDLGKIKAKIENIETFIYAIGEDIKNLRGKHFRELLNIRKTKLLNSKQYQDLNQIYIPLKANEIDPKSGKKIQQSFLFVDKDGSIGQVNQFIDSKCNDKDVMLIRGVAGSGKSKAARKIEEFIWEQTSDSISDWIPIYVQLSTLKDPRFNLIDQVLESESYQFDKIQIRQFKEALRDYQFKLLLILDSYDEMTQEFQKQNLCQTNKFLIDCFNENEAQLKGKEWLKVIITTRTEILTQVNYQSWFYGESLASLKEIELEGFDEQQQSDYLEKYTSQSIKWQLYEFYESAKQSMAEQIIVQQFQVFWTNIENYIKATQNTENKQQRSDFILSEQQIKQILSFIKQEKLFQNTRSEQLMKVSQTLSLLWSKQKYKTLIVNFGISQVINTPFMMEIVVKVLPNMIENYQDVTKFKLNFIENFVKLKKVKNKKIEENELAIKGQKIWEDLEGKNTLSSLLFSQLIVQNNLQNIEDAEIIIAALKTRKLVPFDFYQSFIDYYHQKQITRQMQLGKVKNQSGLLQDLFDFSQSLALDMTINKLTSFKYEQQSQLKLRHIKQNVETNEEWKQIYFDESEYKKIIRSCILLNQQGNMYSFSHKQIQEFFVSSYLFDFLGKVIPEDNQPHSISIEQELYNQNEFNISQEHFNGILNLLKEKMLQMSNLKQQLIFLVKLSKHSSQFIRASSNSIYLLSFNNNDLKYQELDNIKLNNTKLNGLSFYSASLENSQFENVNISMCNFNCANIKNSNWNNIQCNELPSLCGHQDCINSVVFLRKGNLLFSSSSDSTIRIWDFKMGIEISKFQYHKGQVHTLAISRDGRMLASGGYDKYIIIWDLEQNAIINTISFQEQPVFSVDFSPDCQNLAIGSSNKTIYIYSMRTFELTTQLEGHQSSIKAVAFSSDNFHLASGSEDKRILIWNTQQNQQIQVLEGHTATVYSIAFSLDNQTLASGSFDETVRLWNIKSGCVLFIFEGHSGSVNSVAFSPISDILASGSFDETIRLWDTKAGKQIALYEGHSSCVKTLAFSPDGLVIVSGGGDKNIRLWNVEGCFQISLFDGHTGNVNSLAFSSDGLYLASCSYDETIKIWDVQDGKLVEQLKGHTASIYSVTFSPNNEILASCSDDDTIRLWDVKQFKQIAILQGHQSLVKSICFSSDGTSLASASYDQTIRIWKIDTFQEVSIITGHQSFVNSVIYIPNSQILASASSDETIRLWDTREGNQIYSFEVETGIVNSVSVTDDGLLLAAGCGDKTIRLLDIKERKQIYVLKGHISGIYQVAFAPQGKILASGGQDKNVRLWSITTKQCIAILEGHKDIINSVQFSGQNILASASDDKTIRLWDIKHLIAIYETDQSTVHQSKKQLCYKILAKAQAISADHCQISGSQFSSGSEWNLKSLLIQKGAVQ